MQAATQSLVSMTAGDLMTTDVVCLPREMSLREAVQRLLQSRVESGAVVNSAGECVGVLSAADILRLAGSRIDVSQADAPALPLTCSYLQRQVGRDGRERVLCTLPEGVCPIQRLQMVDDKEVIVCSQPHCVLLDFQLVNMEKLPRDDVGSHMTVDPIAVLPTMPVRQLALRMVDAHFHEVFVIDENGKPIGRVTAPNLLAALMDALEESAKAE